LLALCGTRTQEDQARVCAEKTEHFVDK